MPIINCLESAKKSYRADVENSEIESVYDALVRHTKTAKDSGANLFEELNKYAEMKIRDNEQASKAMQLQNLISMQAVVDSLKYIELFDKAGHKDQSVYRALKAKMSGSVYNVARSRDNTNSRMLQAREGFERDFAEKINNDLSPLFLSREGQPELAQAMIDYRQGKTTNTPYGRLANIIGEYQDKLVSGLRSVGIDINELDDRVAPNIHSAKEILKLSMKERSLAKEEGKSNYEFARDRWKADIFPLLDADKTFTARGVDVNSKEEVDNFLNYAFDNLVNKGKVSQNQVSFSNKFKQPRVFHWKDADSLVKYNGSYGTGAIQDSIVRELAFGFARLELIKDFGVNPVAGLERTLRIVDENPKFFARSDKGKERKNLTNLLTSMMTNDADYPGTIAAIGAGLRAWEVITKLGAVVPASINDLRGISQIGAESGKSRLTSIPSALKHFVFGMSKTDKKILNRYMQSAIANKIGQVARYYVAPFAPRTVMSWAMHTMHKLNLLGRWDNGLRGYAVSLVSQDIAEHSHVPYEKLADSDKQILSSYNIGAEDWDMLRQSKVQIGSRNKKFITPDSVQDMDESILVDSLKRQGVKNISPERIQDFKNDIERKFATYFRDRQDHAVAYPDAIDKESLTFGVPPEKSALRAGIRIATQFKSFGLSQTRKIILPTIFKNGATTYGEAFNPLGGKSNWTGVAGMTVEFMVLGYISIALKNIAQGLSPPLLNKADTWVKMFRGAIGTLDLAFDFEAKDLLGSFARIVGGPVAGDITKLGKIGYAAYNKKPYETYGQATGRSTFNFVKNNIPFGIPPVKWVMNHLILNSWEDSVSPGKREKDLREIEQNQGAHHLF